MGKTFIVHSPVDRGFIQRDIWPSSSKNVLKKQNSEEITRSAGLDKRKL